MRRARNRTAIRRQRTRSQLVGHEYQQVRAIHDARLTSQRRKVRMRIISRRVPSATAARVL
jgi:hypothetical protein